MRPLYHSAPPRAGLPSVLLAAVVLTLAVFLILPLTQMVSAQRQAVLAVRPVEIAQPEPPPAAETPPPPPPNEPEPPPEPPPQLTESAPPPMNLSVSLDVALGSGGAMDGAAGWIQAAVAQAGGPDAFSVEDLERLPELLSSVPPVYPDGLRRARIEGAVTVAFVLDETGRVEDLRVESSTHQAFEAPVLEALRRWKFKPGQKEGQPVRTFLRQTIRFRLPDVAIR